LAEACRAVTERAALASSFEFCRFGRTVSHPNRCLSGEDCCSALFMAANHTTTKEKRRVREAKQNSSKNKGEDGKRKGWCTGDRVGDDGLRVLSDGSNEHISHVIDKRPRPVTTIVLALRQRTVRVVGGQQRRRNGELTHSAHDKPCVSADARAGRGRSLR
jgi:hypothetical protein